MASTSSILLSLSLCSLFLFHITFAQIQEQQSWGSQGQAVWGSQGEQGPRQRAKTDCRIEQLTAQEPNRRIQSKNGEIHFWDSNRLKFVCAGVEFIRYTIRPQGLLMPGYFSAPQMVHIVQGRGILGTVIPGCAETFESESQGQRGQRFTNRHQKLRRYKEGDIVAVPVAVTNWVYNDGDRDLIAVALIDTRNHANQLDNYFRNTCITAKFINRKIGKKFLEVPWRLMTQSSVPPPSDPPRLDFMYQTECRVYED